ncbi:MAG TPA: DUF4350 domain-containing protein [Actinoplanes sp.]|nr:DUF4350 domain-containing protein [Actinoplanes sp.]
MSRRRRLRFAVPPAVVLALVTFTLIVHGIEQPDPDRPSFLSPVSSAGDGADRLAARLAARGVTVDRRTSTPEAVAAVVGGNDATLFITTPQLVHADYLRRLATIPPSTRVVLVAPTAEALARLSTGVSLAGPRWTAAAAEPGCAEPFATAPAAVLRWRFAPTGAERFRCYADAVVELESGGPPLTLVGATDPFRNDRLDEHGNAGFAVGLLARSPRVVWLDLHEREQPPPRVEEPVEEPRGEPEPVPRETGSGDDISGESGEQGTDRGRPEEPAEEPDAAPPPVTDAFPPAFWATVLIIAVALVALALAAARRLGTPVPEPLPTRVRAAETVRGLGGLYRRAHARDASLATVQAAAVRRLARHFGRPPESSVDDVAQRVAGHTGQPPGEIRVLLGGGVEDTDEDLAVKAAAVQRLVRQVTDEGTMR